eukprot:gene424-1067_t
MATDYHGVIQGAEKASTEQSLICLLHACKGYVTTIELRDESSIIGKIENVDGYMNIRVSNAKLERVNGHVASFQELFIQGKQIRFVHIPDEIDIRTAIKDQLRKIENTRKQPVRKPKRGRNRKR